MFVINSDDKPIPLAYFAKWQPANAPLSVNHQGLSAASTISFNLPTGRSLSEASEAIDRAMTQLGCRRACAAPLPVPLRCSSRP
ncbi:multidrug transporter MdtC [Klebsiella pneumoniae]|uniref:Multidrug transporter MdtC n=1 Tax=Klebsiella pneumoniae TaxID=573 RepID=A0A2X3F1Y9_KLEPN|nr:multidrug transporter MdtC [Klebsiella pneumoniae]